MVLSVRPVFVGGPLHGHAVDWSAVERGQDYVALEYPDLERLRWEYDSQQQAMVNGEAVYVHHVHYSPRNYVLVQEQGQPVTIRDVFKIKVWVDTRLCQTAQDRLMWEIVQENRWPVQISGVMGPIDPRIQRERHHGQPEGPPPVSEERGQEMQAGQVPDARGRQRGS